MNKTRGHGGMSAARRNDAAFTLVEMLVVIGIIGVLAAMILPVLGKAKSKARTVECQNNLRQLVLANTSFAAANDDAFPLAIYRPQPVGTPGEPIYSFDDQLYEYLGQTLTSAEKQASRIPLGKQSKLLTCPQDRISPLPVFNTPNTWRRTYSMSEANMSGVNNGNPLASLQDGGVGVYYSSYWGPPISPQIQPVTLHEHQIAAPATTLLFVERPDARNFAGNDHFSVTRNTASQKFGLRTESAFRQYHGGQFVYSYCDGHVVSLAPEKTWGTSGSATNWAGEWTIRSDD